MEITAVQQWLRETIQSRLFPLSEDREASILATLLPRLRPAQVLQAAVSLHWRTLSHLIVVYDNCDRLPSEFQDEFLAAAIDKSVLLDRRTTIVLALRSENIGGGVRGVRADSILTVEQRGVEYPFSLLPVQGGEHLRSVIDRRNRFVDKWSKKADIGGSVTLYDDVGRASRVVAERLESLQTSSVGIAGSLGASFARFYCESPVTRKLALAPSSGHQFLPTIFFLWLRAKAKGHHAIPYTDLMSSTAENARSFASMVSAHHMLIARVGIWF